MDNEIKKKVIEDWKNAIPQLSLYGQNKLYKIVGPLLIGLELIKLPREDEYRPHFVIYPIWEKDLKTCINNGPIVLKEYYNRKDMQYSIPYERHSFFFDEVLESVKKQTLLAFDRDISLQNISFFLDEYSKTLPLSAAPDSYLQARLQEAKLKITLYIGVTDAEKVLGQISGRSWDVSHFKAWKVDPDEWLQKLNKIISNREEFLKQIEINRKNQKIIKLHSSILTA